MDADNPAFWVCLDVCQGFRSHADHVYGDEDIFSAPNDGEDNLQPSFAGSSVSQAHDSAILRPVIEGPQSPQDYFDWHQKYLDFPDEPCNNSMGIDVAMNDTMPDGIVAKYRNVWCYSVLGCKLSDDVAIQRISTVLSALIQECPNEPQKHSILELLGSKSEQKHTLRIYRDACKSLLLHDILLVYFDLPKGKPKEIIQAAVWLHLVASKVTFRPQSENYIAAIRRWDMANAQGHVFPRVSFKDLDPVTPVFHLPQVNGLTPCADKDSMEYSIF